MKYLRFPLAALFIFSFTPFAFGQKKAEVTFSLNEAFFDAALEAVFQKGTPLEFSIAKDQWNRRDEETPGHMASGVPFLKTSYKIGEESPSAFPRLGGNNPACTESIKILHEVGGVRTAVRFRDGKILAPLAFSGNYNPPFLGCVPFSGWAESVVDLEFDQQGQRLIARARVLNVNLTGTGGVGGTIVAKLVQSSIDKKVNPIELFELNKLSFVLPVKGASVQIKATGIRHELVNGAINVVISYEFV